MVGNAIGVMLNMTNCANKHGPCAGNPLTEGKLVEGSRHCAFCLKYIPKNEVKKCSKCHKRAYCSKECQTVDWKSKGRGQGHKNWCELKCGEEDEDWQLFFTPSRGTGLRAKRTFPPYSRILVDGLDCTNVGGLSSVADVSALVGTLQRALLANHECNANAAQFPILTKGFEVMVLYALKEIKPGEEICHNYTHFNDTTGIVCPSFGNITNTEESRALLLRKWGIICSPDCFCRRPEINKQMQDNNHLYAKLQNVNNSRADANRDLEIVCKLLTGCEVLHSTPFNKAIIKQKGFEIAIQQNSTMDIAMDYIREAYEFYKTMGHKESELAKYLEPWMKSPKSHPNYKKFEK